MTVPREGLPPAVGPERGPGAGAGEPRLPAPTARLSDLARGTRARVVSVTGGRGTAQRLLEMGLTPGVEVEVVRFAPLGDPIELRVRGYSLSLRREDAKGVAVRVAAP